jgi:DNA-binding transcriptional MerR regulator
MNGSELIKIGKLAKEAGVRSSKIRFYIKEQLMHPADHTEAGYQLFDRQRSLYLLRHIQDMQERERLTIPEIRERLRREI